MIKKLRVGILFGRKSPEHEISLLSALNIITSIDQEKYEPVLIGIDKEGEWHLLERDAIVNVHNPKQIALDTTRGQRIVCPPGGGGEVRSLDTGKALCRLDCAFPILHGPFGEDGTLQGLLKLVGIPFVGAGVLGSAVGMDKDVMKRLLRDANIPIGKFLTADTLTPPTFDEAVSSLGLPLFIKPANLGSSVGVNKVHNQDEYNRAINEALQYDAKIVIEEYMKGREIECAVLGGDQPIASLPGEIIPSHEFYSYQAKYIDPDGAQLVVPAWLPSEMMQRVRLLALQTFQTLCCEGFARVDFFLAEDSTLYVNEINTIPGFTSISMYPKMWEASGLSCTALIDRLIELAQERFAKEQKLRQEK